MEPDTEAASAAVDAYRSARRQQADHEVALMEAIKVYLTTAGNKTCELDLNAIRAIVNNVVNEAVLFDLFGDESHSNTHTAYGVIGMETDLLEYAAYLLSEIKKEFGGSVTNRLHC